jgi:hypothetical protein
MARHSRNSHTGKLRAGGVLLVSIVGFSFIAFQNYDPDPKNRLVFNIIITIAAMVIAEKVGDLARGFEEDQERERIGEFFSELPSYLVSAHDIVCFRSRVAALEHCIRTAQNKNVTHIFNTALRYNVEPTAGNADSRNEWDVAYYQWIKAREQAVVYHSCVIREIISKYLSKSDPIRKYAVQLKEKAIRYHFHKIDDVQNPMVQMTIFGFDDHKEIVFGWEYPGAEEGRAFLSTNSLVVEYFEQYFKFNYEKKTENMEWAEP